MPLDHSSVEFPPFFPFHTSTVLSPSPCTAPPRTFVNSSVFVMTYVPVGMYTVDAVGDPPFPLSWSRHAWIAAVSSVLPSPLAPVALHLREFEE
jgi:hypothetical protein